MLGMFTEHAHSMVTKDNSNEAPAGLQVGFVDKGMLV